MVIYFGRIRLFTFAKIEDEDIYHSYEKFYHLYTRFPTLYSLKISLIFNMDLCKNLLYFLYICYTQIDVQPLIDVQSSNPFPISTSQTSVTQIYVLFSNYQIGVQFSNLWPFLTFSNRRPMTSLMYALTVTNKLI